MSSAKDWGLEIDKAWLETQDDMRDAVVTLGLEAIKGVIFKSPVGNADYWTEEFKVVGEKLGWISDDYVGGRFRGNWYLTFGAPSAATTDVVDPGGEATMSRNFAEMSAYPEKSWPAIYLANNLPYAERLENGYSKKAPNGMVAITLVELAAIWEKTTI